jgi:protocatechuate 3,4-dioxygenase beta subunit
VSDEEQPKPLRRTLVTLSGTWLTNGRTVITDDQGRFQFSGLAAGQYSLTANKEGFVPRSFGSSRPTPTGRGSAPPPAALTLRAGELQTITIRLPRGAVISGTVTDTDGQPLEGVLMAALANHFDPRTSARQLRPTMSTSAATDDRGNYRIFGLPAGTYVVSAQATSRFGQDGPVVRQSGSEGRRVAAGTTYYPSTPDQATATRISVAAGEERDGVDVQVQYVPTATIAGVVVGDDTAAPENTRTFVVLGRANDPSAAWLGPTPVDASGQFTFHGVAPGRYTLRAQSPGFSSGSVDATLKWGTVDVVVDGEDVANVSIQLLPTVSVSGKVVFNGATSPPAPGAFRAPVPLVPPLPMGLLVRTPLQFFDDGRFTITGIVPGNYLIGLPGSAARGLQTPIGTSSGTSSGAASGASSGASSGSWWVKSIVLEGRELLDAPVDISHDSRDAVVTVSDQASVVAGAVKNASEDPIAGALVVIFSADRTFWFVNSRRVVGITTDARGRYTVRNLPPGDYRAVVAPDLEQWEWYDPDMLQRLLPAAVPFTIAGVEAKTLDLVVR